MSYSTDGKDERSVIRERLRTTWGRWDIREGADAHAGMVMPSQPRVEGIWGGCSMQRAFLAPSWLFRRSRFTIPALTNKLSGDELHQKKQHKSRPSVVLHFSFGFNLSSFKSFQLFKLFLSNF